MVLIGLMVHTDGLIPAHIDLGVLIIYLKLVPIEDLVLIIL